MVRVTPDACSVPSFLEREWSPAVTVNDLALKNTKTLISKKMKKLLQIIITWQSQGQIRDQANPQAGWNIG